MLDESKRQSYLKAMGVTQWQLRSAEVEILEADMQSDSTDRSRVQYTYKTPANELVKSQPKVSPDQQLMNINGLSWLTPPGKNGLLVVLSEQRKGMNNASRKLMSKMLKSIHFLPSETGFAVIADADSDQ